jgi:hypothetical protein
MNAILKTKIENDRWVNERGAALITTLLVATMLLIVGGALILTTNMAAVRAVDSTSELQAYYSAEAGVNSAINVLRRNVQSNPANTAATFRNVVNSPTLNTWLNYDTTINGTSAVSLSNSPVMGYSIALSDPDNTPVADQPTRLLLQVTGYGPKGAMKQMEVLVDRYLFDYSALATILLRGDDDNSSPMGFAVGQSNAKIYSGNYSGDPTKSIPVMGVTHAIDKANAQLEINNAKPGTIISNSAQVQQFSNSELPSFLQTADNARSFLNELQAVAVLKGRYFSSTSGSFGTDANPELTFVDGNCSLTGGAGLLIVTGALDLNGAPSFNGLILVLGEGNMFRSGGGSGDIYGAIALARFARTWPVAENSQAHPFLWPTFDTSGGGTGTIGWDPSKVEEALSVLPPRVVAIREH